MQNIYIVFETSVTFLPIKIQTGERSPVGCRAPRSIRAFITCKKEIMKTEYDVWRVENLNFQNSIQGTNAKFKINITKGCS